MAPAALAQGRYSDLLGAFLSCCIILFFVVLISHLVKQNIVIIERVQLDKDIQPLSEFRANATSMIEKIKTQRRLLVITQHGKSSAVLLNVCDYQQMVETIELLQEINQARQEIEDGKGIEHEKVMRSLKEKLAQ
jgi:prevent-host-death family protein